MDSLIVVLVLIVIIVSAAGYIIKAKKSGAKCIGCPASKSCSSKAGCCSCGCENNNH